MDEQGLNHVPLTGWYPGHMLKAGRGMRELLRLVDVVVELVDARAPRSSRNPELPEMLPGKPFVLVANKADLATAEGMEAWRRWFRAQGISMQPLDSRHIREAERLVLSWKQVAAGCRRQRGAKRPLNRPVRIMIAGIPNVGKSTLVNHLVAGRRVNVGPLPGVTRHTQWVPLRGGVDLLDTPGVLWPHIREKAHELRLGLIGSIPDDIVGVEFLGEVLWQALRGQAPGRVCWDVFALAAPPATAAEFLDAVARRRGLLRAGGDLDRERAAAAALREYREGRLGRFCLEMPAETDSSGDEANAVDT
ncbi:MAG: ribosome biogenesis GTPase YlqF [Lentisphaeria bacterium]|nr:ribosome biogenesis GTPase YlqF [Lentisphaeria bacterium]